MSDEMTNPERSIACDRMILRRPRHRLAIFSLTISFVFNVAFWGTLIYCVWSSVSAVGGWGMCRVRGVDGGSPLDWVSRLAPAICTSRWRMAEAALKSSCTNFHPRDKNRLAGARHYSHPGRLDVGWRTDFPHDGYRHSGVLANLRPHCGPPAGFTHTRRHFRHPLRFSVDIRQRLHRSADCLARGRAFVALLRSGDSSVVCVESQHGHRSRFHLGKHAGLNGSKLL